MKSAAKDPKVEIRRLENIDDLERGGFSFTGYESDNMYRVL
jgi:hypothetical protein